MDREILEDVAIVRRQAGSEEALRRRGCGMEQHDGLSFSQKADH